VTFTNNFERDYETLRAFKEFREEAERKNFRYFLEAQAREVTQLDHFGLNRVLVSNFVQRLVHC